MPFLCEDMRYIATNHFTRGRFVFSKIVPTRHEKFFRHDLQRNLPSVRFTQWASPQYGHTTTPSDHRDSIIALWHRSFDEKYDIREIRLLNLEKSIIVECFSIILYMQNYEKIPTCANIFFRKSIS